MRRFLAATFAILASSAVFAAGMGEDEARHLLSRTGYGVRLQEIDAYAKLSRREGVDRILDGARASAVTPLPPGIDEWVSPARIRAMEAEAKKAAQAENRDRAGELRAWWVREMLATDSPLTERMTLFWHNHFATGIQKVRSPMMMARQNAILRRHALGSFRDLLHGVSKDPAMLVYLDTARSRRGAPNENFAREVMELFTLGEGHYSERDIKEAARAFTGWSVDPETGGFLFRPMLHDDGEKTVLGRTGALRGEDVLEILLARRETAEFIAAKLWREFVSGAPPGERERREIQGVARELRESGYSVRAALRALLSTQSFWAPEHRAALVKSPVDVVVGTLRQFSVEVRDPLPFAVALRNLGQDLFAPPNVKGWPGGEAWVDSRTLLARRQFVERVLRVDEARLAMQAMAQSPAMSDNKGRRFVQAIADLQFSGDAWLAPFASRPMPSTLERVLLAQAPQRERASETGIALVRALVADPVYQLR